MANSSTKPSELYCWQDYEWYAADAAGHVAVFTSAGIGPIPLAVLETRAHADSLAEAVWNMPPRGGGSMLVSPPRPDDYLHFASRGFFAYDWQDVHRTLRLSHRYEMLSKPENPIKLSDLPEEFQPLLRRTTFSDLFFAKARKVDVQKYFECESAARSERKSLFKRPFSSR